MGLGSRWGAETESRVSVPGRARRRGRRGAGDEYPVRVLLATDAAREGVNLQGRCADLFNFDIPWNPARMEQRNGRIDRTGQDEPVVRCHYFRYTERAEDLVLATLVRKVGTIERELGSLGALLQDRVTCSPSPSAATRSSPTARSPRNASTTPA